MAALLFLPPAFANFDFAIARGRSVANDEMVGESILHVPNAAMVVFKGAGVALARPAVVDGDVAPAAFAHTRTVDLGTHGTAQIFPAFPPANRWCWLNILRIFFLDGHIGRWRCFRWRLRARSDGFRCHGRRCGVRRSRGFWFRFRAWRWFRLRHRLGSRRRLRSHGRPRLGLWVLWRLLRPCWR